MEKIKRFFMETIESEKGKDVLIVIIVIVVGLVCFELGRLSVENNDSSNVDSNQNYQNQTQESGAGANVISAIEAGSNTSNIQTDAFDSSPNSQPAQNNSVGKNFFASSKGKKYYPLGCSAGKTIKEANKIYFATGEEAQSAGYTLSSSCQ